MNYEGHELTEEQEEVVTVAKSGVDQATQSPAGGGKTFVLKAVSQALNEQNWRGIYLAFNRGIADSAGKSFPKNVLCKTNHSLAYGKEGYKYRGRLKNNISGGILMQAVDIGEKGLFPSKANKAYLILTTIRKFCYSADPELTFKHIPYLGNKITDIDVLEHMMAVLPVGALKVWEAMIDTDGDCPITHDVYLKKWALNNPYIPQDFILYDEFQDANPVMLDVVMKQHHAQKLFVGDKFQQIYQWRGAVNALDQVQVDKRTYLSQSFRFGDGVAEVANNILQNYTPPDENPIMIKGNPNRESILRNISNPDAGICRTNGGVITQVFQYIARDKKVYIQGGAKQLISLLMGAKDLMAGKQSIVPELALFKNWEEVKGFTETDEGEQLKSFVRLVENHGVHELLSLLYRTEESSRNADIVLTTAHKCKGLEFGKVKLGEDFVYPTLKKPLQPGEINILYTAATRALDALDITCCPAANVPVIMKMIEMERKEEGI